MGKSQGGQTVTQRPDPNTGFMQQQIFGSALGAAGLGGTPGAPKTGDPMLDKLMSQLGPSIQAIGPQAQPVPGVDPLTAQAGGMFSQGTQLGNLGLGALSGDRHAFEQFNNPYQRQVLDAVGSQFDEMRAKALGGADDLATRSGAFGGSRHGIASGVAAGQLGQEELRTRAALTAGGFDSAMQRAMAAANFGMGSAQQGAQMGEYNRQVAMAQDPAMRRLEILKSAMGGMPSGSSVTQPTNRNAAAGALGGAASGAGIASALGAATPVGWGLAGLGAILGGW